MKKNQKYISLLLLVVLITACSVRKNNWANRNYHALVTHYNIYFNGNESYKEGLNKLNEETKDDYSNLLPLYPISIPDNGKSIQNEMDKTIEKCRKAIKLHSIQKKPKINQKKIKDAKYQAFLQKEEYNSQLKYAWILQGKAEFHKGDFMGAVATFSYILRHYSTEFDVVLEAKMWQARAYAELGWLYEAEEVLSKVNPNEVGYKLLALYEGTTADLLLKQKRYKEAIPFLKSAITHERNKIQQARNAYVLAQLYQMLGDDKDANVYFQQVMKNSSASYTMNFNAQINSAQLVAAGDTKKVLKSLKKMAKDVRNKEFLDQIYFAQGNIYLKNEDEASAIESYKKAIESSSRNGIEKALVEIKLADLYYDKRNYLDAQPCYSDASQILKPEHDDYRRVMSRAEVLSELLVDYQSVVLQDSLQRIAQMPKDEQLVFIEKVIENVIKEEESQRQKEEEEAYAAQRASNNVSSLPNFQSSSADWYFYNSNLINKGKSEFVRKWGNRRLEDNWRRQNKMMVVDELDMYDDDVDADSLTLAKKNMTDNKKPEYYLNQLPNTPIKLKQSNEIIANALFDMGYLYSLKLEDDEMALETFNELQKRFPQYEKLVDSYFYCYQIAKKRGDEVIAQHYSNLILKQYPESSFALILSKSDYVATMSTMYLKQDSLYEATYHAYTTGDFATVKLNYDYMNEHYKMSTLMPKFAFLNAMSVGKTQSAEIFKQSLENLVTTFPQSDVTSMSKDILALMEQGKEAQQGSSHGTLLSRREVVIEEEHAEDNADKNFQTETATPFMIVFEILGEQKDANKMLYDVASFNFTKFLIKDFDLKVVKRNDKCYWLVISGLENFKDAQWYFKTFDAEPTLHLYVLQSKYVFISEDNYKLLGNINLGWDEYVDFYQKNILSQK